MIKVMIVDDEPFIRQGLKILIDWEQYGYEVCWEASNGAEALEMMKEKQVDLVITDIKMPLMDGIGLIGYCKKNGYENTRFIILSGFYEFEYAKKAIKYEVEDYILKPVQREELVRVLEDYKERHYREREEQKKLELTDKIVFDSYLNSILTGNYDSEGTEFVMKYLTDYVDLRYIDIEYDRFDDEYQKQSKEEKLKRQSLLYEALKEYLGCHWFHAYMGSARNENDYSVGFIYAKELAERADLEESVYINELYEFMKQKLPYKPIINIGQRVEDITMISESFKSAQIARNFQRFSNEKHIAYYEEIKKSISTNKEPIDKELMDALIFGIEKNDVEAIEKHTEAVYSHFKDWIEEPEIIKINLDYLVFNLINLAKELDAELDQAEVYEIITQGNYDPLAVRGSITYFRRFAMEVAEYFSQLRQQTFGGVLKEVEREIIENYKENLSLKMLSEKYYVNSAYLGQIFRRQFGVSFKDYLNSYRIDRAAELLIRTDEKVYRVAEEVGFNNTDYFISKFVQMKGITPLQYRKQYI